MEKSAARDALGCDHNDSGLASPELGRCTRHRRIVYTALAKWLVTVTFAASIYFVLWAYSSKIAMVSGKKREFNVVITGLAIAWGLSTSSSLKGMVRELRWWLLSLRQYSSKEVRECSQPGGAYETMLIRRIGRAHPEKRASQLYDTFGMDFA